MKNSRTALLLIVLTTLLPRMAVAAEIYKIIGSDGSVRYSDQAPPEGGSEAVELPDLFLLPAVPLPSSGATNFSRAETENKTVRILSPMEEEVIHGTDNQINISAAVSPSLSEGERLQLIHNGSAYGPPQTTSQWHLTRLIPGTHKFSVQVLDEQNRLIGQSSTLTIYVII